MYRNISIAVKRELEQFHKTSGVLYTDTIHIGTLEDLSILELCVN